MAGYGLRWWQDVPESDEFVTVLHFLTRLDRGETHGGLAAELLASSNEHRTLTSRLAFVAWRGAFGPVNFAAFAILGCLLIATAIVWAARAHPDRRAGWLLAVLLSLAVFNLQHFENLFCSCASADHFTVVLLTTASLALLTRGSRAATGGAMIFAGLATLTLAHGLAVLPAGALLLAGQRRWRELAAWAAFAAVAVGLFLWSLEAGGGTSARLTDIVVFWITLAGGLPALDHRLPATILGGGALAWLGWLSWRGAWRREPFLLGLAACAAVGMAAIAYGRAGTDTPVLSSRYLVQSAFLWCPLLVATLRCELPARWQGAGAFVAVALLAAVSVASNRIYATPAAHYHGRRTAAALHYDRTGSMQGLRWPLFPLADHADRFLREAERAGVFTLHPPASPGVEMPVDTVRIAARHHFDRQDNGRHYLHLDGWLLAESDPAPRGRPVIVLRDGARQLVFRSEREARPDVAATYGQPADAACGFRFVLPKAELGTGPLDLALGFEDGGVVQEIDTDRALRRVGGAGTLSFRLGPRFSQPLRPRQLVEAPMEFHLDELASAGEALQVRGWLLPPATPAPATAPVLLLRFDDQVQAYRGTREKRPDVAEAFQRPDAVACGFRFVIPAADVAGRLARLDLGYEQSAGVLYTPTNRIVPAEGLHQAASPGAAAVDDSD